MKAYVELGAKFSLGIFNLGAGYKVGQHINSKGITEPTGFDFFTHVLTLAALFFSGSKEVQAASFSFNLTQAISNMVSFYRGELPKEIAGPDTAIHTANMLENGYNLYNMR